MFKNHTVCRVCGNDNLVPYLDLGMMPLSNNLLNSADEIAPRYPLKVQLCERCGLSQLTIVVDPETLFGHYVYRSSISQGYKDHCREMAIELREKYSTNMDTFHIDIAGNDGALLAEFKKINNYFKCLNVDPAVNLAEICEKQGIRAFTTFWGIDAVNHLQGTGWPDADLVTATNVFAHVDNVQEFLHAIKLILKPDGVAVIEFPYLIDFIEKKEFDTVYFEHLSYFSIMPLDYLCSKVGLKLVNVTHHDIHGGSVRCFIQKQGNRLPVVDEYIHNEVERGFTTIGIYRQWAISIAGDITDFSYLMGDFKGQKVYGFAASAKGNTLLNCAGITAKQMRYIVDQTPEKIGKFSPGTGIEIISMEEMLYKKPDYLVLLSWNFEKEIKEKCKAAGYTGKFINPLTLEISS